jgi:beta-glucosidase
MHADDLAAIDPKSGLGYLNDLPVPRPHIHETRKFPDGFLWGTATSAHQVEGGTDRNDWHDWEQQPAKIIDGTVTGRCTDHYNRYEEDFDLAQSFHNNAHRLSVEWSRIETADGGWDYEAIAHYRRVLESLHRRGFKVMLTAWHFTLPRWLADKGGWQWAGAPARFARFCRLLAREYGDLVDFWVTINEPMVYLGQAYGIGVWPPGKTSRWAFAQAFFNIARGHRMAYRALHRQLDRKRHKARVGIAKNIITFEPYRKVLTDTIFVRVADNVFNHQFFFWTRRYHDYIGINYYFNYRVKYLPTGTANFFYEVHAENREQSDLGWEINAAAIFRAIMDMWRYRLPIYITEHGVANADDAKRPRLIINALREIYHAIKAGADVRGYFHWSLLDNYEWEKGFSGRFGLVAVDYLTLKRTPRRSAYIYAEICRENGIPHHLLKFTGHGIRW